MSKYDKEREAIGIKSAKFPSFSSNKKSKYATEREAILSGKPLATPKPEFDGRNRFTPEEITQLNSERKPAKTDNQEYWDKHPVMNFLANNPVSKFWDEKITPFLDVQGQGLRSAAFGDNSQIEGRATTTGNKTLDTVAKTSGNVLGFFMPAGGGASSFAAPVRNAAEMAASKIIPKAGNFASKAGKAALTGALESIPYSAQQVVVNKDLQKPGEALKTIGTNALLGVGGELAVSGLSSIGKALFSKIKAKEPLTSAEVETVKKSPELLALPEVKQYLMLEAPKLRTPDIIEGMPPKPTRQDYSIATSAKQSDPFVQVKYSTMREPVPEIKPEIDNPLLQSIRNELGLNPTPGEAQRQTGADALNMMRKAAGMGETRQVGDGISNSRLLQSKTPSFNRVSQYKEAEQNVLHNVPEQYRKETPFTVAKSTLPPKVQSKYATERLVNDLKPVKSEGNTIAPPVKNVAQNNTQPFVKENKFARTIVDSDNTLPGVKEPLKKDMPEYAPITNKDTLEKARQIIESDIDEATRIVKGKDPATAESNAMAQLLIQKAQQEGRFQDAIDIVEVTSKKATDAGQAIQALSMWNRLTPEGMLKFAQKTAGNLTPEDAKHITDSMNKIKDMAEGRAKTVETAKVLDYIASKTPPSLLQKINTLQTMAQLLNPKTAIRNIGGNTAFAGAENVSNVIGAGLDKAIGLVTGKRTMALPSLGTQAKGFGKGFKLGLEDALKGIDTSSMKTQFDLPQTTFRKGPLAALEKAMNIELKATDRGFYQAAYDDSLRQQMKAAKVTEPTQEMLENAHLDGMYRTFQDDNYATKAFTGIKNSLNTLSSGLLGGKEWGLGDVLIKYPKTPANLLMRGIDYSPAGVVKTLFNLLKGFDQRDFVQGISRGIVGTSILGAGIVLYDLGIITGKRDKDKDVDALQRTTGGGGYRLNLSALKRFLGSGFDKEEAKTQNGDKILNYDWLQPLSIPFAAGANIGENNKEAKVGDILSAVVSSLEGGVSTLAEQPLVQGLTKLGKGYDIVQSIIETAAGVPASFVPTALNQVRQLSDNTSRNINDDDFLKKSANMVKNKIPGLSKTLPERVDTLGQTQKVMQDNNLFNVFLNPAFTSKYESKPEAQLPLDIFERTGSKEQFPRTAAKSVTLQGQKIDFTPKEQAQFQRYIGEFTAEQFRNLTNDPAFMESADEYKIAMMKKILDFSTEQAKMKILTDKGLIK